MDSLLQKLNRDYDADPSNPEKAARLIAALRRVTAGNPIVSYTFRHFPANIVPDDQLWGVYGACDEGGGVLEWCVDREDAITRMRMMRKDPRFHDLSIGPWADRGYHDECGGNDCEQPTCHRCFPQPGCDRHAKCIEAPCDELCARHADGCDGYCDHTDHHNACLNDQRP